jgi:hypothetical protein
LDTTPESEVTFVPFLDLNDVPVDLAQRQGAALSLDMVNEVVQRAYELGTPTCPNTGKAWSEFGDNYTIQNNLWVKN